MNEILISVIIPVYNAEKYVERAISSLLNQTTDKMEVILVDDGSPDNSGTICDKYASKYQNISVVHKKNGGSSTARNAGIKVAKGSHISFLDADDYFDDDTYEKIINIIEKYNPDCIDFGYKYINDHGEVTYNQNKLKKNELLYKDIIYDKILPPLLNLKKDEENFIFDFAVNKIYKREVLDKGKIFFDENRRTWEDRIFVVEYLKYCDTFYSMDECFYNYVSVPNSLSRRYDIHYLDIILANYNFYKSLFGNEFDFNTTYAWNYWCHSIENMILRSLKEKENKDEIIEKIRNILSNEQVIEWYLKRVPENDFEKQCSDAVIESNVDEAISLYMKKMKEKQRKQGINSFKQKVYNVLKKFS